MPNPYSWSVFLHKWCPWYRKTCKIPPLVVHLWYKIRLAHLKITHISIINTRCTLGNPIWENPTKGEDYASHFSSYTWSENTNKGDLTMEFTMTSWPIWFLWDLLILLLFSLIHSLHLANLWNNKQYYKNGTPSFHSSPLFNIVFISISI